MKLTLGLLVGLLLGLVLGFKLHTPIVHTQYYQIKACTEMYMNNINPSDMEIQEALMQQHKTLKELVQEHCRWYVVDSSQTFTE